MLMRFGPFRDSDRVFDQAFTRRARQHADGRAPSRRSCPLRPAGRGPSRSTSPPAATVSAERHWEAVEGDELVANERRQGTFSRQMILGNALDVDKIHATYENGVLTPPSPSPRGQAAQERDPAPGSQQAIDTDQRLTGLSAWPARAAPRRCGPPRRRSPARHPRSARNTRRSRSRARRPVMRVMRGATAGGGSSAPSSAVRSSQYGTTGIPMCTPSPSRLPTTRRCGASSRLTSTTVYGTASASARCAA